MDYVNLIEIGSVITEIRGAENSELAVPVNNTLMRHIAFLAADTPPCVLMAKSQSQIQEKQWSHIQENHGDQAIQHRKQNKS